MHAKHLPPKGESQACKAPAPEGEIPGMQSTCPRRGNPLHAKQLNIYTATTTRETFGGGVDCSNCHRS